MTLPDFFRLLALAAIWGGSFLFTRIGVPDLGAMILVESRVGLAALFLLLAALFLRIRHCWSQNSGTSCVCLQ